MNSCCRFRVSLIQFKTDISSVWKIPFDNFGSMNFKAILFLITYYWQLYRKIVLALLTKSHTDFIQSPGLKFRLIADVSFVFTLVNALLFCDYRISRRCLRPSVQNLFGHPCASPHIHARGEQTNDTECENIRLPNTLTDCGNRLILWVNINHKKYYSWREKGDFF